MEKKINQILEDTGDVVVILFMLMLYILPFAAAAYVAIHFIAKYW
jgi:hypothetical protein